MTDGTIPETGALAPLTDPWDRFAELNARGRELDDAFMRSLEGLEKLLLGEAASSSTAARHHHGGGFPDE
ncbi:MAG TPA: hypothetical protein VFQ35_19940 [Polyangiaceae bacterium]|nr:hypothetical protein [Polyangiaceae bacterium]